MSKTLLVCVLLALVPLANLRMICIDHRAGARPSELSAPADCKEICARDAKPGPAPGGAEMCLLVAGGCSAVFAGALTITPPRLSLPVPAVTRLEAPADPQRYLAPVAPPFSPPPEL